MKKTKSDKYKYVYYFDNKEGKRYWYVCFQKNSWAADSEKNAAIKADKKLIEMGKEPVNILKRK